jgi:hypothetical protein
MEREVDYCNTEGVIIAYEDRGEHALKGVGEPQRVYAVRRDVQA